MTNTLDLHYNDVIEDKISSIQAYEALNTLQLVSEKDSFTSDRYRQFFNFFPANARRVLDLGCNTGRGGVVFKHLDRTLTIYGLDCVKDRLERIPHGIYDEKIYSLSTDIPLNADMFDVVVAGELLEHLYPADIDQTLIEVFRILKVGGRFMLTTPNPGDIKRKLIGKSVLGGCHVSQHFHDVLRWRMKMVGFSRLRVYGSGKVSRYLGSRFPFLPLYGSYLAMGDKK